MGRLIDADEMLDNEAIAYMKAQNSKTISALTMQVNKAVHAKIQMLIADTPTVDAKPVVHGEWKRVGSGSLYDTYECTNCHRPPKWDSLGDNHWRIAFTDICPHCGAIMNGADMRGGKNE